MTENRNTENDTKNNLWQISDSDLLNHNRIIVTSKDAEEKVIRIFKQCGL